MFKVVVETLRTVREHSQRGIVAHGSNSFGTSGSHRLQHLAQILKRVAERLLQLLHIVMLRIWQLRRFRKLIQTDQMLIQPLAVRLLGSDLGFNFLIRDNPALLRIYKQHTARSQTVFV
ncbi:hypothetical protein D3C80_1379590 [compost metagenome]